jgi:hypothetical protein
MTDVGHYDPDEPLARALFAAGRAEVPSRRALEKTLGAMPAGAAALTVADVAHTSAGAMPKGAAALGLGTNAAAPLAAALFAKWIAIGLGAGFAAVAAADGMQSLMSRAPAATTTAVVLVPPPAAAPARTTAPPVRAAPAPRSDRISLESAGTVSTAAPPPANAAQARAGDSLESELARVDAARAALGGGRWGEAFSESQRYEREHPNGRLLQEALLIRMRALEQMGDASEARAVARRLIRVGPSSPHAGQARALLQASGEIP